MSPQKRVWLVVGIVAILALVGAFHYYKRSQQVVTPTEAVTSIVYSNVADGVTFSYPSTYALETHELDIEGMKGKYLTLTPADIELPDAGVVKILSGEGIGYFLFYETKLRSSSTAILVVFNPYLMHSCGHAHIF
jgi:hypothetical protein